jgi:hypothetical protein
MIAVMLKYFTVLSGTPETVRANRIVPISKIAAAKILVAGLRSIISITEQRW